MLEDPSPGPGLIRRNVAVTGSSVALGAIAGFAAQVVLARDLGSSAFGVYISALSLAALVRILGRIGGAEMLVRTAARDPDDLGTAAGRVLALTLSAGAAGLVLAPCAAILLGFHATGVIAVALLAAMVLADAVSNVFRVTFQAIERLEIAAMLTSGVSVLSGLGIVLVVRGGGGLLAAIGISMAVSVLGAPAAFILLRRHVRLHVSGAWRHARRNARASFPFAVVGVLAFGAVHVDALLVRAVTGQEMTGLYGAALRGFAVICWVPLVGVNAVYRTISRLSNAAREGLGDFLERATSALFLLALPLAAAAWLLSDRLLPAVFGPAYVGASNAFRILALSLPLVFPGAMLLFAIVSGEHPGRAASIVGRAVALNLVLNGALVPSHGIEAAAAVMFVTQLYVAAAATRELWRCGVCVRWWRHTVPGVSATAVMAVCVASLRDSGLVLAIDLGALVYGLLLVAMRVPRKLIEGHPARA